MENYFAENIKEHEILMQTRTGLWFFMKKEGEEPQMYLDKVALDILGLPEMPSPEDCYRNWYDRIEKQDYPVIKAGMERLVSNERVELQHAWNHPECGLITLRYGGVMDSGRTDGIYLRGYLQNITDTVIVKRESEEAISTLSDSYSTIVLCNLEDKSFKIVKMTEAYRGLSSQYTNYEKFLHRYIKDDVAPQYHHVVLDKIENQRIQQRFLAGEKQIEIFYRNRRDGWRRIKILPATGFSAEAPWAIAAFDKQDGEMERRMEDATAQVAVAQIYTLVISVDLDKGEYNCIHYSGLLLELRRNGPYEKFYWQMAIKMPVEDRVILERIFDRESYRESNYLEGIIRLSDENGVMHYYSFYSACIKQGVEERILMTARNVDDKQEAQQREDILSNLCRCYYSIYLIDFEADMQEALWQEDVIAQSGDFPKGSYREYYSKFIRELVHEKDREKMERAGNPEFLRQRLSMEQPVYDVDFRRLYGEREEWVRARFSIAEIIDGRVTKIIFASTNINEQKLNELQEEREKQLYFEYQNIIKGLSAFYHSVFYVDLNTGNYQAFVTREDIGNLTSGQNKFQELIQTYKENFIYEVDKVRFGKAFVIEEITRRIAGGETIFASEFRRDYGGYFGWMRVHVILAESQNGIPAKIILAAHNVEEEKEQEEQNRQALYAAYETAKLANEAKSSFMAQMSHDIRTPMNAIIGMAAIASTQTENPEKVKDCLKKIDYSSKHLLALINEVLDMSKIEKGKIELLEEPFSLLEMMKGIEDIAHSESEGREQQIKFDVKRLIHTNVIGDEGRIRQVLLNLITNAVKYTPNGGKVRVAAHEVSAGQQGYGSFVFTVDDNGIGMSKEFLDYIFVPFSRAEDVRARKIQGSGLGMSIAQGIVTAMKGNIQAESEVGIGTRFTVTLSLRLADPKQIPKSREDSVQDFGTDLMHPGFNIEFCKGKRILLAEDNKLNMEIAQTILENMGFLIDGAENGQKALEEFITSEEGTYQAVLMDLQMPVMDGYTSTRQIRRSKHPQAGSIPIIALTANAFAEDITKALVAGMNDHVSKPIDYNRLLLVLKKYI